MATLITNSYRYNSAKNFVESFNREGINSDHYYVFASNHQDYANSVIKTISDDVYETSTDVYKNMLFGKFVMPTDTSIMIRRVQWQSSTRYAMYDDKDPQLNLKDFFVYTDGGSVYHVWKCLSNNNNALSTVMPTLSDIGTDGITTLLTDGYTWKYMFSIPDTTFDKFATPEYIPYVANTQVINSAINGEINSFKIITPGIGYSNYIEDAYFQASDVRAFSNPLFYKISTALASNEPDFYNGCILYIKSGTGAGQHRTIQKYYVDQTSKYVALDSPFTIQPTNDSRYTIAPRVYINSDQFESEEAVAYAEINLSQSNSISNIIILNPGKDYKIATANVYAISSVGVSLEASVRPILSPPGGHGSNPANELYCSTAAVSIRFGGSEGNTIPTTGQFRQIGLITNPIFSSVTVNYSSLRGGFQASEQVISFYPKRVQANVSIDIGTRFLTTTDPEANFNELFAPGDRSYISDGNNDFIFTVKAVNSNTEIEFNEQSIYQFVDASAHYADIQAQGTLQTNVANKLIIDNVSGHIKDDANIIGIESGAIIEVIDSIQISGKTKQFDTFVATYRYDGSIITGDFQQSETVTQGLNTTSNALFYTAETIGGVTSFYVTNQNGIFNTSNTINGQLSGAVGNITTKYSPEIVFGGGTILYLENLDPITRTFGQGEVFKLVFEF